MRLLERLRAIAVDCALDHHRKDGEWKIALATVTKLEALPEKFMSHVYEEGRDRDDPICTGYLLAAAELRALLDGDAS